MTTLIPKFDLQDGGITPTGAVNRPINEKLAESVSVLDFGADPTGVVDSSTAFNNAIAAAHHVHFPAGNYKLSSTITISDRVGLVLEGDGAALTGGNDKFAGTTIFNFDTAASGTDGLVFTGCVGIVFKNVFISHIHASTGGGAALYFNTGHDFIFENIKVDSQTGSTGYGIRLGSGVGGAAFIGKLQNCKVISEEAASFLSDRTNTSLTFDNCYQIGGFFNILGTVYSTFISCASENAPQYGYIIEGDNFNNCQSLSFITCAGEANGKGVFFLYGNVINCFFSSPYGAGNNTLGSTSNGDLFEIDGTSTFVRGISIFNPTVATSNPVTTSNIYANAGTGEVDIYGAQSVWLAKGVAGDTTWKEQNLTITGDTFETMSFTATPTTGWTFVGTPTVVSKYIKKGHLITFSITITPATSLSSTACQISIPWTANANYAASTTDGNSNTHGIGLIANNIIYLPAISTITVPLVISGQFSF